MLAGTCLFSLTFPLVSPIFFSYMAAKDGIDAQNLRLFYTAREHQPMLLRTGVQVAMVCPVLGQATVAIYHLAYDVNKWSLLVQAGERDDYKDAPVTLWAGGLLIVNATMMLMAQVCTTFIALIRNLIRFLSPPGGAFLLLSSGTGDFWLEGGQLQVQ